MMLYILLSALSISMLYSHAHAIGSQYSGQWSLTGCSPANSTTCSNIFTPINEIYYVADTLTGTLYYVPYSPVNGSVSSLTYNGTTVTLTTSPLCQGTWTNAGVTASCSDGSTVSIACNSGPCRSSPTSPSPSITGLWSTTSYCKSYQTTCSNIFSTSYNITITGTAVTLTPTTPGFQTASLQTYSDGTMMVANSQLMCFGRPSPLSNSNIRVICGYSSGAWAETDFQCTSGACLASPTPTPSTTSSPTVSTTSSSAPSPTSSPAPSPTSSPAPSPTSSPAPSPTSSPTPAPSTTHQPSGASITSTGSLAAVILITLLFFFNIY